MKLFEEIKNPKVTLLINVMKESIYPKKLFASLEVNQRIPQV